MQSAPDVGDPAVDFSLASTRGELHPSELVRDGAVLLVFHPRDHTLVCTRQLCNYRDNLSTFEALDVQIVAINDDPLATHEVFARKYDFPFPLASDPDRRVCRAHGALVDLFEATRSPVLIGEEPNAPLARIDSPDAPTCASPARRRPRGRPLRRPPAPPPTRPARRSTRAS
jgi:peroxiredoxin